MIYSLNVNFLHSLSIFRKKVKLQATRTKIRQEVFSLNNCTTFA